MQDQKGQESLETVGKSSVGLKKSERETERQTDRVRESRRGTEPVLKVVKEAATQGHTLTTSSVFSGSAECKKPSLDLNNFALVHSCGMGGECQFPASTS